MSSFERYTDVEWEMIREAAQDQKGCPTGVDWPGIRAELEQAGRGFWVMQGRRSRFRVPKKAERQRLRRRLHKLMKVVRDVDVAFPVVSLQLKPAFESIHRLLEGWDTRLSIWHSKFFEGQRDAYRDWLYALVCELWTDRLGGKLGIETDDEGDPSGSFIRFFDAATGPILGPGALSVWGIRGAVRRVQAQRGLEFWGTHPEKRWENPSVPARRSYVLFDHWSNYM